jgi:AmmeMemoRadiSam system protein A
MDATESPGIALISRARNAVATNLGLARIGEPHHPDLQRPGATFVTLFTAGALHGCIGSLEPERLLGEDVRRNALAAAFHDPRFAPLTAPEFACTRFEVSLLGPSQPLQARHEADAVAQLVPHRDGVTLLWGNRRATLLPQVWASVPERHEFLAALKAKAGLPRTFWSPELRLERYAVTHFDERCESLA